MFEWMVCECALWWAGPPSRIGSGPPVTPGWKMDGWICYINYFEMIQYFCSYFFLGLSRNKYAMISLMFFLNLVNCSRRKSRGFLTQITRILTPQGMRLPCTGEFSHRSETLSAPSAGLPKITLPSADLPKITLPSAGLSKITLPSPGAACAINF